MEEEKLTIGELLLEHHMIYRRAKKRMVPQKEFAKYLGLGDQKYNQIFKGKRKPNHLLVKQFAEFFDDTRFYEAAGLPIPDPRLNLIQSTWRELPNEVTKQIVDIVTEYRTKKK